MNHYVGCSAAGSLAQASTFTQSGGSNTVSSTLYLGYNSDDSGSYTLTGTGFLSAPTQFLGYCGTGTFTQSGGTNTAAYGLYVGQYPQQRGLHPERHGPASRTLPVPWHVRDGHLHAVRRHQQGLHRPIPRLQFRQQRDLQSQRRNANRLGNQRRPGDRRIQLQRRNAAGRRPFSTTQPFTLATSGGNATIDTAGYAVTISGPLSGPGGLVKVDSKALNAYRQQQLHRRYDDLRRYPANRCRRRRRLDPQRRVLNNGTLAFNRSDDYTVSSPINGSGGVTQIGPGTLTFAAANNYSGTTLASGGTLALANSGALQQSTLDTSGAGCVTFESLTAATLGGLTGGGTLALTNSASAPVAITVRNDGISTTYSGVLSGSGSLTKLGSGTLTLTGSNSYSGGTSVAGGVLAVQGRWRSRAGRCCRSAKGSVVLGNSAYQEPLGLLSGGGSAGPLDSQSPGMGCPAELGGGQITPALGGGINAVPEPGTMALLAAAAACGLAAAWRRAQKVRPRC